MREGSAVVTGGEAVQVGEVCRLRVVGPGRRVELAVPSDIPLAELMPSLLRYAGDDLADAGNQHDGWVLQRLGEPPLDEARDVASLGLHDGDVVLLRPRRAELPPADFDDLVDAVATGAAERADRWRPAYTHRLLVGLIPVPAAVGIWLLLQPGPVPARVAAAAGAAVVLLIGALVAKVALRDRSAAGTLGAVATATAAVAGGLATGLAGGSPSTGAYLLGGGAAALGAAGVILMVARGDAFPFLAVAVVSLAAALGGAVDLLFPMASGGTAAVVAVLALLADLAVPMISAHLGNLRIGALPTGADELQENTDPLPGPETLARVAAADRLMTVLLAALGAVAAAALPALCAAAGWSARGLAAAVAALLLLRARSFVGARQRLALIAPGALGLATVAVVTLLDLPAPLRLATGLPAMVVAGGLLVAGARHLPGRRLLPYWGRAGDICEWLLAIAVVPLALAPIGVYSLARALGG
ncbi:type VII secretion integral membrane protein EccD [Planosporangium thailandense]|uniref:Type VII secretion integral membrane protein EccD n=1 Tax=Planosporangium thailandense TaxID=765197 RepID=A0ABX0Y0Z6_9ACTN|nr:type VII secretion integral membrane protein EccD [Planosporangium thailandense]